jgi:hypothetical protein
MASTSERLREGAKKKRPTQKSLNKKQRMVVVIENLMEMRAPTGKTLSFRYVGNPPAQRRARFAFRRGPPPIKDGSTALTRGARQNSGMC